MNQIEKKLLTLAYEKYSKTNSRYVEIVAANADELLYYTEAAEFLSEENYIVPLSDNIGANSISIIPPDIAVCFEITDLGLRYVRENIKDI